MIKVFYKIKHLPTGLFFRPGNGMGRMLNKIGKTYDKKPSLQYVKSGLVSAYKDENGNLMHWNRDFPNREEVLCLKYDSNTYIKFDPTEWKIIKYTTIEEEIND